MELFRERQAEAQRKKDLRRNKLVDKFDMHDISTPKRVNNDGDEGFKTMLKDDGDGDGDHKE